MEMNEANEENSNYCTSQSQWLQTTISSVNDKMKAVMNVLEDNDSTTQDQRKHEITKIVQELCTSYATLAHDYDYLLNCLKQHKHNIAVTAFSSDDLHFDVIDSNPASIVEDPDYEDSCPDSIDLEDRATKNNNNGWMKSKFNRMFEENTELQMELIRRNSEKRDVICKLEEQVARLVAERDMLKRHLSYVERHKPRFEVSNRKLTRFDRFFRCSF